MCVRVKWKDGSKKNWQKSQPLNLDGISQITVRFKKEDKDDLNVLIAILKGASSMAGLAPFDLDFSHNNDLEALRFKRALADLSGKSKLHEAVKMIVMSQLKLEQGLEDLGDQLKKVKF